MLRVQSIVAWCHIYIATHHGPCHTSPIVLWSSICLSFVVYLDRAVAPWKDIDPFPSNLSIRAPFICSFFLLALPFTGVSVQLNLNVC